MSNHLCYKELIMSQHPSLRVDSVGVKHRNVLKRLERIKKLQGEGRWDDEKKSIYNLPKVRSMKIKVKKGGGKEKKEGDATAAGAAPAVKGAAKPAAAKPAAKAVAKPAAKAQEKK